MIFSQPEETNDNILSLHFHKKSPELDEEKRREMYLKKLLYDDVTKLPTLPIMFDVIQDILNKQGQMGFLYINIVQYSMLEQMYGWRKFDFFMKELAETLVDIRNRFMREHDAVCEVMIKGSNFMLLLSSPRTKRLIIRDDLSIICQRIGNEFNKELKKRLGPDVFAKLGCYFGYSILEDDPTQRLERLVYKSVEIAHQASLNQKQKDAKRRSSMLQNIVVNKKISTLYQPILDLDNRTVMGYEALNRGPKGQFEKPDYLFRVAYENNVVWALDRLCRNQAFKYVSELKKCHNLFINVEPGTFEDPLFLTKETLAVMEKSNINPSQVVLEVTERKAIEDFENFRNILKTFKASGFKVAIDDLGTGYSGLNLLSELLPDYIDFVKLDMSLIRNIHTHDFKQQIITFLLNLTKDIDTSVIVEGIEHKDELKTIRQLGVRYAQGFFFASPSKGLTKVDDKFFTEI